MSTTSNLKVALEYSSQGDSSLILKIRTETFMARGASIRFISAFPGEEECLYPALTYMKPTGKVEVFTVNQREITVVEVAPHFGSA